MKEHISLLKYQEQELRQAFRLFDKDGNGYLDKNELVFVLRSLGEKDDSDIEEIFNLVDLNQDGKICIDGK